LDEGILPYTEPHAFVFLTIARKTNQDEGYITEDSFHKRRAKIVFLSTKECFLVFE
jgi:hypothetical protein